MVGVAFERPVGAKPDMKELEYLSALHQTGDVVRPDGSIFARDIVKFLMSRYGIEVTEEQVRKTILEGLGGSDAEEECIDLTEVAAILIIPVLVRLSQRGAGGHDDDDGIVDGGHAGDGDEQGGDGGDEENPGEGEPLGTSTCEPPICYSSDGDEQGSDRGEGENGGEGEPLPAGTGKPPICYNSDGDEQGSERGEGENGGEGEPLHAGTSEPAICSNSDDDEPGSDRERENGEERESLRTGTSEPPIFGDESQQQTKTFEEPSSEKGRDEFGSDWEYRQYLSQCEVFDGLELPDSNAVLSLVLGTILRDSTGSASSSNTAPPALNEDLVRRILLAHGETDLAADDVLVREMVDAARQPDADDAGNADSPKVMSDDGRPGELVLDSAAFLRALTNDVRLYDVGKVVELTTNYDDVFGRDFSTSNKYDQLFSMGRPTGAKAAGDGGSTPTTADNDPDASSAGDEESANVKATTPPDEPINLRKKITAEAIDFTCDTYRSKGFVCIVFVSFVLSYYAYMYEVQVQIRLACLETEETVAFGCHLVNGVLSWLLLGAYLCISGLLFVGGGSLGNAQYSKSKLSVLAGMIFIGFFTFFPFFYEWEWEQIDTHKKNDARYQMLYYFVLILGCVLLVVHGFHLVELSTPRRLVDRSRRLARIFTYPNVVSEARVKRAAIHKLNLMVQNAYKMHAPLPLRDEGSDGEGGEESPQISTLLTFSTHGQRYEHVNIRSAWRSVIHGELVRNEGVWLSSRLIAANIAQLFATLIFATLLIGSAVYQTRSNRVDAECVVRECSMSSCGLSCSQGEYGSFDNLFLCYQRHCSCYVVCQPPLQVDDWVIITSFMIGTSCGFVTALVLTIMYVPSYICTVLKFRSGILPSLHGRYFADYRYAQDNVSIILGSMFWGVLFTGVLISVIIGGFVFLTAWEATRPIMLLFIAQILGLLISIGIKLGILCLVRARYFSAFYRNWPFLTNFISLALECWNIGLSSGYMLARALRLILASIIYIGRIDKPILDEGIKVGPLSIDAYPMIFRKDILAHEAHRHPWMDLLGVIYLYKLRYRQKFAKAAGSCWRLLFVFALMPWLRKYRLSVKPVLNADDDSGSDDKDRRESNAAAGNLENQNSLLRESVAALEYQLEARRESYEQHLDERRRLQATIDELEATVAKLRCSTKREKSE